DLDRSVFVRLVIPSHVDRGTYGCELETTPIGAGVPVFRLRLSYRPAEEGRVAIDGKVRRVYRCQLPDGLRGIRAVSCDGCLVARVVGNQVVLRTFLFLTMEGTPEARELSRRLGLSRPDIEYEGLDRLETFLSPSFRADAELAELLRECGCGSLLGIGEMGFL